MSLINIFCPTLRTDQDDSIYRWVYVPKWVTQRKITHAHDASLGWAVNEQMSLLASKEVLRQDVVVLDYRKAYQNVMEIRDYATGHLGYEVFLEN